MEFINYQGVFCRRKSLKTRTIIIISVLLIFSVFMDIRIYSVRNGRFSNSNEATSVTILKIFTVLSALMFLLRKAWFFNFFLLNFFCSYALLVCSNIHIFGIPAVSVLPCYHEVRVLHLFWWQCRVFLAIAFPSMHYKMMNYSTLVSSNWQALTGV